MLRPKSWALWPTPQVLHVDTCGPLARMFDLQQEPATFRLDLDGPSLGWIPGVSTRHS